MSSYNGILTVSCIRAITQMALKLSEFVPLENVSELIKSFQDSKATWQVRIEASRALLDLEFYSKGIDAALILFIKYLEKEPSLRGQVKLGVHMIRLSEISAGSGSTNDVKSQTLVALLRLLEGHVAFCNVLLRHHLFCILQVLAGRCPTLYVIPRDHMRQMGYAEICSEQRNTFLAFINQMKPPEIPVDIHSPFRNNNGLIVHEGDKDLDTTSNSQERRMQADGLLINEPTSNDIDIISTTPEKQLQDYGSVSQETPKDTDTKILQDHGVVAQEPPRDIYTETLDHVFVAQDPPKDVVDTETLDHGLVAVEPPKDLDTKTLDQGSEAPKDLDTITRNQILVPREVAKDTEEKISNNQETELPVNDSTVQEPPKDLDTVSHSQERRMPVFKIRVKQPATSNKGEVGDNMIHGRSQAGHNETDHGASSSVSVDAPQRNVTETISISNQMIEVNSCQGQGSHMTASIGSAKVEREGGEELGRELQCTADSSSVPVVVPQPDDLSSPNIIATLATQDEQKDAAFLLTSSIPPEDVDLGSLSTVNPDPIRDRKEKRTSRRTRLFCTADSSSVPVVVPQPDDRSSPNIIATQDEQKDVAFLLTTSSIPPEDVDVGSLSTVNPDPTRDRKEKRKKDKDKKRKRDDPEYLEKKRLKKEKKQREKERAKWSSEAAKAMKPTESPGRRDRNEHESREASLRLKLDEPSGAPKIVLRTSESRPVGESGRKIKIKIKKPGASGGAS